MAATLPGVNTTLIDTYSALEASRDVFTDRVAIIARTGSSADADYAHDYDPRKYMSLQDVRDIHGADSELYEAFFHALYSGCTDIWLVPIPETAEEDRTEDLNTAYDALYSVRPSIVVPYGRGAQIDIDTDGTITRSVPVFGSSPTFPDGAYVDSSYAYASDLAKACDALSSEGRTCIGILGFYPFSAITASDIITELGEEGSPGTALSDLPLTTTFEIDESEKFLQVVLAEVETAGMGPWPWRSGQTQTYYRSNGALNYAGTISRLIAHDATTGKTVQGVSDIAFRIPRTQMLSCIASNVVAFDVNNGLIRVVDGMTYADDGSDFERLSTVRIAGVVDDMVRRVGQKFIGKGMNMENRNALVTGISTGFGNLIKAGALLDADFKIRFDGPSYTAYVDSLIIPAWELRRIALTIKVNFAGTELT